MNERIQKLYEQSFVTDSYVNVGPNGAELGIRFDPEKFAELIVRECIECVRSQYITVRDSTVEGRHSSWHPNLRVRNEREEGIVECGVNSVIALEELIQEQTNKWYKENIEETK